MKNFDFSPLFWPVKLKKDCLLVLDETKLPQKREYIKVKNYLQAAAAIKTMKTRAVGQILLVLYTFLFIYRNNKNKNSLLNKLKKAAAAFDSSRPTLAFRYLTAMVLKWAESGSDLEKNILGFLDTLKRKRIKQAEDAAKLVRNKDVILTHCNLSGIMPLLANFCREKNKAVSFYVTETRPYLQGARLTAWELSLDNFAVTVITDNMAAEVMDEGKINKVIVGADNLAQNGDIANKVGTYQIAILAKYFKIPFYAVCPPASSAKSGGDIKIEKRPGKELLKFAPKTVIPKGAKIYYPAFDITPGRLITKHIYLEV